MSADDEKQQAAAETKKKNNKAAVIVLTLLLVLQVGVLWWQGMIPGVPSPRRDANEHYAAQTDLSTISAAIDMYRMKHKALPTSLDEVVGITWSDGTPVLAEMPTDPWGRAYRYQPATRTTFDLRSAGADGVFDSEDDVVPVGGTR